MKRVTEQQALFADAEAAAAPHRIAPAEPERECVELAAQCRERFGDRLRLGTSSWSFGGWGRLVWARVHSTMELARHGLPAYARHPLFGCVSLDRSFYGPLDAAAYAGCASQVPRGFRFVVKAASAVCDASVRDDGGNASRPNPRFLDAQLALDECVLPAARGLGDALGAIVFQLSPLPRRWLDSYDEFLHDSKRCGRS